MFVPSLREIMSAGQYFCGKYERKKEIVMKQNKKLENSNKVDQKTKKKTHIRSNQKHNCNTEKNSARLIFRQALHV